MRILLASHNRDKKREVASILSDFEIIDLHDMGLDTSIPETGLTLKENALIKASFAYEKFNTLTIADDTGLVVWNLMGMPGVFSSRFAGEKATYKDNRKKLLKLLEDTDPSKRRASFFTVVTVFVNPEKVFYVQGRVDGIITHEERGLNGFGYDSVFLYPPLGRTFGEIPDFVKNRISHRARAFKKVKRILKELVDEGAIS